jgi:hypothetical protein
MALVVWPCRQDTIGAAGVGDGDGSGLMTAPDCVAIGLVPELNGLAVAAAEGE